MSLNYEMARYTELTGEDGTKVPISRLGGYLDGYAKGRADALDEFARAYEHTELIGCEDCKHLEDDIHCWRCIAEQLKENKK